MSVVVKRHESLTDLEISIFHCIFSPSHKANAIIVGQTHNTYCTPNTMQIFNINSIQSQVLKSTLLQNVETTLWQSLTEISVKHQNMYFEVIKP